MPRKILYENDEIVITLKREMEIGDEYKVADMLLAEALVGYKTFALFLKDPASFINDIEKLMATGIETLRNLLEIRK